MSRGKKIFRRIINRFHPANKFPHPSKCKFRHKGGAIRKCKIFSKGTGNSITIAQGTRLLDLTIKISGNSNLLEIGQFCKITGKIEIQGDNCTIRIGNNTKFGNVFLLVTNGKSIEIGDNCLLSTGIDILTTDSHKIYAKSGERINFEKSISIGDNVWIGTRSIILKGSILESGSVIAALSLTTGVISSNCVAAGIPARVIQSEIKWMP